MTDYWHSTPGARLETHSEYVARIERESMMKPKPQQPDLLNEESIQKDAKLAMKNASRQKRKLPEVPVVKVEATSGGRSVDVVVPMSPMALLQQAVAKGDLALVEKMLDLQRRIDEREDARNRLAAEKAFGDSLCAAQSQMRRVSRDASNPQTRSKYASYENLDRVMRPIYTGNGFSISFKEDVNAGREGYIRVIGYVRAHGHTEPYPVDIPCDGKGAKGGEVMTRTHAFMAAVAYGRRAILKMIFNIAEGADVDDDGNSASEPVEKIDMEQAQKLKEAIAKCGATEGQFCKAWKIEAVTELAAKHFDQALKACEDKARERIT